MKSILFLFAALTVSAESLHYSINYPSGLSLGEATLDVSHGQTWSFSLDIDAGVPGFAVRDHYQSGADADLCGISLDKNFSHGTHKSEERVTFDQQNHRVTRETKNGGKSDSEIPSCARGALAYLQFVRNELVEGRLAAQQPVIFGAAYDVRLEFAGTQTLTVGEQHVEADRIDATIKGPASDVTVEVYFSRDKARTPLLAKIPMALGTFSVELVR